MIFPAIHFNFSNQGVGLLTFKIKVWMKIKESEIKKQ